VAIAAEATTNMSVAPKQNDFGATSRYRNSRKTSDYSARSFSITSVSKLPTDADDDALMAALATGDSAAARLIMDRHLTQILALSRRMLGDQTEAEDVAQDTFARAWGAANRWEPGRAKLSTWLHRIAMNLCLDRLRKKRPEPLDPDFDGASDDPDPEMKLAQQQIASRIDLAIQALPERQRGAIVLSHYQHLSNPEAAGILDVSVEAFESLLSRGRKALRVALRPEWTELTGGNDDSPGVQKVERPERGGR
jgi:RNA polymerase sigma-70 factor, ECF subfamily